METNNLLQPEVDRNSIYYVFTLNRFHKLDKVLDQAKAQFLSTCIICMHRKTRRSFQEEERGAGPTILSYIESGLISVHAVR